MSIVRGTVIDRDGTPVAGVTVGLSGFPDTTTDANGEYNFTAVADNEYLLTVVKDGFTFIPAERDLTVSGADVVAAFLAQPARYTYDPDSIDSNVLRLTRIRSYIPDTAVLDPATRFFADVELLLWYNGVEAQDELRTAARAIETIARNEVLVIKMVTLWGVNTNTKQFSEELRAHAQLLRQQSRDAELEDEATLPLDVVEFNPWINEFA